MSKAAIILLGILLTLMVGMFVFKINALYCLGILSFVLIVYVVLWIKFFISKKKKTSLKLIEKYDLEDFGDEENNKYFVIPHTGRYSFSYIKDGRIIVSAQKNVQIEHTDKKPYLEIYENEYTPKGILEFLFYNESLAEEFRNFYKLYVNKKID